jgi:hypothetical protein
MGPHYIIRNQDVITTTEGPFKLKPGETDRVVAFHNTVVNFGGTNRFQNNAAEMLDFLSRNNLYIDGAAAGGVIWNQGASTATYRTDLNYDGFDWGPTASDPFTYGSVGYATVAAFAAASGQENNGLKVVQADTFTTTVYDVSGLYLTLKNGATAIDAGVALANINDDYNGAAPDLGAYEFGAESPVYGPRSESTPAPELSWLSIYPDFPGQGLLQGHDPGTVAFGVLPIPNPAPIIILWVG